MTTETTSDELRSQLSLDPDVGLTVFGVAPDSPAAKAGLRVHDILLRFGDQILMDPDQFANVVRARQNGDNVMLTYLRKGKETTTTVTLGERANTSNDGVEVINVGDFNVDVNKLIQQMPQLNKQLMGVVSGASASWSGRPTEDVAAMLKNLKMSDTNLNRIMEETVKAMNKAQAEQEK